MAAAVSVLAGCATTASLPPGGQVVVITGASSGFGRGVALKLSERGANVVLAARRTELLNDVARECQARGGTPLVVTTDVGDAAQMQALARAAVDRFGRIDVWINNAGVGIIGRFEDVPLADDDRLLATNVNGVVYGSYYALRQFRAQHSGTLINISSVDGKVGFAYQAIYAASKHAVRGLGAAIYQELRLNRENGIHVCTIMPYAADTPWWQHAANYSGHTPHMLLIDPPEKVVDAIVHAIDHPKREIAVGYKAKLLLASERMSPALTERLVGDVAQRELMETPPMPVTSGALHQPMPAGTGVEGGWRAQVKKDHDAAKP